MMTLNEMKNLGRQLASFLAMFADCFSSVAGQRLLKVDVQGQLSDIQASACPICQTVCEPKPSPSEREMQTSDGHVALAEPVCHCSVCHRDSLV